MPAYSAGPAADARVDHHPGAGRHRRSWRRDRDLPDDLMAQDDRGPRRNVAVDDLQVGPADAAGLHGDDRVVAAAGLGPVGDAELTGPGNDSGAHQRDPSRTARTLRLLDTAPVTAGPGEETVRASVTDLDAMTAACQGADSVIHLAGIPGEAPWPQILEVNIDGTYAVFEAARRAGTGRIIYASSNHAVGFSPRQDFPVRDYAFPAPDTYYGVSKVAGEALAALYHHRHGLNAICIRILTCDERPTTVRSLSTWLSPDDAGRLFEACPSGP